MNRWTRSNWILAVAIAGSVLLVSLPPGVRAAKPELKGKFELLKDEPSLHRPGKVKVFEFADFYCPHCHHFEETAVPLLVKEFGDKVEITMVGFWHNAYAQETLRSRIINQLDDQQIDGEGIFSYERLSPLADRVVDLARTNHARLVAQR